MLVTKCQQTLESIGNFLKELNILSKNCTITAISAELYQAELVRVAFINELLSVNIWQNLLE